MNGRRPNPTYETQRAALEEVIRSLQSMKVSLKHDEAEQRKYEIFISNAAHDLHQLLTSTQGEEVHNNALTAQGAKYATTAPEALGDGQANESAQGLGEPEKAPLTVAPQAPATKPKPWENPTDSPKGLNFHPEAELHAKMNWVCDNVPKMSRLRILREGAMMYCDQLIAMHYREEE
jgi:hypothetical protein